MKKIELGQTLSIIANLGVVAGLAFVGVQLNQDRELAAIDRRQAIAEDHKYWAELVSSNQTIWNKGLSGEPLSAEEYKTFDALAQARQFHLYKEWANSRSDSFAMGAIRSRSGFAESFVREAALEFSSNPGLMDWYEKYQEFLREMGRYGLWEDLLDAEIRRRRSAPND
jgi:hypothetical protein